MSFSLADQTSSLCYPAVHPVAQNVRQFHVHGDWLVGPTGDGIVSNGESYFWEEKWRTERQRENESYCQQPAKPGEEQEQGQQAVALLKGPELLLECRHRSGPLRHCPAVPENTPNPVHRLTYMYQHRVCPKVIPVKLGVQLLKLHWCYRSPAMALASLSSQACSQLSTGNTFFLPQVRSY